MVNKNANRRSTIQKWIMGISNNEQNGRHSPQQI